MNIYLPTIYHKEMKTQEGKKRKKEEMPGLFNCTFCCCHSQLLTTDAFSCCHFPKFTASKNQSVVLRCCFWMNRKKKNRKSWLFVENSIMQRGGSKFFYVLGWRLLGAKNLGTSSTTTFLYARMVCSFVSMAFERHEIFLKIGYI